MEHLVRISEAVSLGMHAMTYMARFPAGAVIGVAEMAEAFDRSKAHLAKVLGRLQRGGLVHSKRGPRGGFTLARAPGDITLREVYEAIDGPLPGGTCLLGRRECVGPSCIMGDVLGRVDRIIRDYFDSTTLADTASTPCFEPFGPA